jgi:hypothetical protein
MSMKSVVASAQHPAPRKPAVVRLRGHHIGDLGGENPAGAIRLDRLADDPLRRSIRIVVGRVDEIDAGVEGGVDDVLRLRGVSPVAEHHRAQADG